MLNDKGEDKNFLVNMIEDLSDKGQLSAHPILVIDGEPLRYDVELKKDKLQLTKEDIKEVQVLKKEVGIRIYGEPGEAGVLVITTKSSSS